MRGGAAHLVWSVRALYPARLAATAGVHLRLDHPELAAERLRGSECLIGAVSHPSGRHRHAVAGEDFLRLIFVQIHPTNCRGK